MSTTLRARLGALSAATIVLGLFAPMIVAPSAYADEVAGQTANVAGSVEDVLAAPVDGVEVELFALVDDDWVLEPSAAVTTDSNGDFAFEDVDAGTYAVRAAEAGDPSDFLPTWYPSSEEMPSANAVEGLVVVGSTPVEDVGIVLLPSPVEATIAPEISGVARVGETLDSTDGHWSVSGLTFTRQWFRGNAPITDASGRAYTLTAQDLGNSISVKVTAARAGFVPANATSGGTAQVTEGTIAGSKPTMSGTFAVGATLQATAGTWTSGTTLSYAWLRNGSVIAGATGATYKLTAADADQKLSVRVAGALQGYSTISIESDATVKIAIISTPKVAGTYAVGETLAGSTGTWTSDTAFTYRWLRDGSAISGATASSYKLTSSDNAKLITFEVTGSKSGYATITRVSTAPSKAVTATIPKVSGVLAVDQTVMATSGTWTSGTTLAYQWLRDGVTIPGATQSSYRLTSTDAGKAVSVKVTGSQPGFATITRTSTASAKVMTAPRPTISGSMVVGTKLTAKPGTWTSGTTLAYAWLRDGVAISGAASSAYTLTSADSGKLVTVKVTGKKSGYATVSQASSNTLKTMRASTPSITGTAKVASTLTANTGTWTTGTTFTYTWLRDGVTIAGATATTYKLTASDRGKPISVKVTGRKLGVTTVTRTSAKTSAVAPGTLSSATPSISGTRRAGYTLTAKPGTWGPSPVALKFQWYRSGSAISNASKSTYRLGSSDVGKAITVKVTGSKTGYATKSVTSAATGRIGSATWYAKKFGVFASSTITGYGDDIISVPAYMSSGVITADFVGDGNFIVWSLGSSYDNQDLLFNEIDYGSGFHGANVYGKAELLAEEPTSYFEITADGAWSITVSPIDSAPSLPSSGYGAGVYKYDGSATTVELGHDGSSNFIVWQYYDHQTYGYTGDLLVNKIGSGYGFYRLNRGPSIVVIDADGGWYADR